MATSSFYEDGDSLAQHPRLQPIPGCLRRRERSVPKLFEWGGQLELSRSSDMFLDLSRNCVLTGYCQGTQTVVPVYYNVVVLVWRKGLWPSSLLILLPDLRLTWPSRRRRPSRNLNCQWACQCGRARYQQWRPRPVVCAVASAGSDLESRHGGFQVPTGTWAKPGSAVGPSWLGWHVHPCAHPDSASAGVHGHMPAGRRTARRPGGGNRTRSIRARVPEGLTSVSFRVNWAWPLRMLLCSIPAMALRVDRH
jgi:hypothetical protein